MGAPMKDSTQRVALWVPCADGTTPHLTVRFAGGRAVSMTGRDCPNEPLDVPTRRATAVLYMPQDAVITPTLSYSADYQRPGTIPQSATVAVYRSGTCSRRWTSRTAMATLCRPAASS
jgi:hypothetical protein